LADRKREIEASFSAEQVAIVQRDYPHAGYYEAASRLRPQLWAGGVSPMMTDPLGDETNYIARVLAEHLPQCFDENEYRSALEAVAMREQSVC
jgi:hypothetical protein